MDFTLVTEPEVFRRQITEWSKQPRLWLDTEVADWFTSAPRLSLLQVRDACGRVSVVDVLDHRLKQVLNDYFIPEVMANASVEKWAHYARFERRFLGQERVANLNCTFELARGIPYYRLPLRSLSLGALVEHFVGQCLDKTLQKADWGIRPLSEAHLAYAAADPEWCRRVYDELRGIPGPPEASEDDAEGIQARYLEILCPLKEARAVRSGIRDVVKELMADRHLTRLSRFSLHTRTTFSTSLTSLVEFSLANDPAGYFDLGISLSARVRSVLGAEGEALIRPMANIHASQAFRGPRTPRDYVASPPPYVVDTHDVGRLTADYEAIEDEVLRLESERRELRNRMRSWMQLRDLSMCDEFRFSAPRERWKVEVRKLWGVIPAGTKLQIAFPQRLWLAFGEADLELLIATGQSKETPVLRWLPRALSVGARPVDDHERLEQQESRDWDAVDGDGELDSEM